MCALAMQGPQQHRPCFFGERASTHLQKFSEAEGGEPLVPYMKQLEVKRKVTLTDTTADPLKCTLFLSGDRLPRGISTPKLVSYTVTGLTGVLEKYNQTGKVQLHFVGDSNGLVSLQKADATVEFIENVALDYEFWQDDIPTTTTQRTKSKEFQRKLTFLSCSR